MALAITPPPRQTSPSYRTLKATDLIGKKVSVQVGTKSVSYVKEKFPQVQLVEKNEEMFNLVDIARADAAVTGWCSSC